MIQSICPTVHSSMDMGCLFGAILYQITDCTKLQEGPLCPPLMVPSTRCLILTMA